MAIDGFSWDTVLGRLKSDQDGDNWQPIATALQELARLGIPTDSTTEEHTVGILRSLSTHPRWQIRQGVAEILPNFPYAKVKEIIDSLRADQTRWVSERAEWARKKLRVSATIDKRDRKYDYAVGLVRDLKRKYPEITNDMMDDVLRISFKTGERYFEEVASQALHQVQNLILSLSDAVECLESQIRETRRPPSGAMTSLRKIRDEKQNLESLFENLMQYARPWEGKFAVEDAESVMLGAASLAQKLARGINIKTIQWKSSYTPSLRLECDRDRLVEAIANIITNGIEAMPNGGVISLSTQPGPAAKVKFIITDTGPGMSPDALETNKRPGATGKRKKGQRYWHSGLGLTYAVKVIELGHGGQIRLAPKEEQGTTLVVELPALRG